MVSRVGLTDLERAKYIEGSDRTKSTVRVAIDGSVPIPIDGTVPVSVEESVPIAIEGTVPVDVQGTVSVSIDQSMPIPIAGIVPVAVQGNVPVNVQGNVPVNVIGTVPVSVQGTAQVSVQGTAAVSVQGTAAVVQATYPILPDKAIAHRIYYFTDGTNVDQHTAVGSLATPLLFKVQVPRRSVIDRIDIGIVTNNMLSVLNYGTAVGGLANGLQFVTFRAGVETVVFTIQKMIHWTHFTRTGINIPVKLAGNDTEQSFQISLVLRNIFFIEPVEYIGLKIRDNLSTIGITYQRASVLVEEIGP